MAQKIKRDQEVVVLTGAHRGKRGKVLAVKVGDNVLIEGVNVVKRWQRKTQDNPEGGSVEKEAPIHYSNVMAAERYDSKTKSK